ncbi:MAG: VWA domain-containing protein [Verrucomicrobiales bacterium]|nr:VWA domain-containing protein [Verrucomicrobiales bacterium]
MKTQWVRSAALAFGLAFLVVAPAGKVRAQEAHDNVVIVLDASGSMNGALSGSKLNKMAAAKVALKEVLKNVPPSTRVGLLVFSARNVQDDWVYPLGPRNDSELFKAIDLPMPGRGTPLGQYIKVGADRLLEERAKQFGYGTFRLLIVTDGEAEDRTLVERYTPDVIARGIRVDVIGVAMASNHTLARRVHSYRAANDPASLRRALSEVFAEVGGSRADQADAEVFALLEPIPAEIATAAIQALSSTDNRPVGDKSAPRPTGKVSSPPQAKPTTLAEPTPQNSAPVAPPQQQPPPPPEPAPRAGRSWVPTAVLAIVVVVVARVLFGRKRRR